MLHCSVSELAVAQTSQINSVILKRGSLFSPPNQITLKWNIVCLKATSAPLMWQTCLIGGTNLLSSMALTWENSRLFTPVCSLRAPGSFVFPPLTDSPKLGSLDWKFSSSRQTLFFFQKQRARSDLFCRTTKPLRRFFWKLCASARGHNPFELRSQL